MFRVFRTWLSRVTASAWTPTVSSAIAKFRRILFENKGKDSIYGKAADGLLPVVVHSENKVYYTFRLPLLLPFRN